MSPKRQWLGFILLGMSLMACRKDAPQVPEPLAPLKRLDVHVHADAALYGQTLKLLEDAGVQGFVNLSGGTWGPVLMDSLKGARRHGDRILVCTNVEWNHLLERDPGALMAQELVHAVQAGARCLKVPKALGLGIRLKGEPGPVAVDDARLAPLWEQAGMLGIPVFIHVGDPAAFFKPATRDNERYEELSVHPGWSFADARFPRREVILQQFERLLANHPRTTFVGVHFGNDPEDVEATHRRMLQHPNLWVDTAARVGEIGRAGPERLRAFFQAHQDRVLFGTDLGVTSDGLMLGTTDGTDPTREDALLFFLRHWDFFETAGRGLAHPSPIQGRWTVDGLNLPRDILQRFYWDNAVRLFSQVKVGPVVPR